jgi:cell division protein FtsI (penicillin-binding protein 3)
LEVKKDILWRVYLGYIGMVLLSLMVLGRAFYISQFQGAYWRGKSDSLHTRMMPLQAERGTIYSEDGNMLSTSIPFFDIYIDFAADGLREKNGKLFKEYLDSLSTSLAVYFGDKSKESYKKELQKGYRQKDRYFLLKKNLSFEQYKALRAFPLVNKGRNKSGFIPEVNSKRLNPFGLLANRTIGLSREYIAGNGKKINQNVGLEKTYDSLLKGEGGQRLVRFISGGAFIPIEGSEIEPENGKDIITTIDVNIQDIAENALLKMMLENEAAHGTCLVMEVATGKLKAVANLGIRDNGEYWEDYNYALRTTEPGSTIKLATLLSVLSEGKVGINDLVEVGTTGQGYVGVRNVTEAEIMPKAAMTIKDCFAHSSNVGMSKLAYQTFASDPDKYLGYLKKFHLNTRTGIDLVGEERPQLLKMKRNKEGLHAMVTMSFGYAIQVSPLQILQLYNSIANNGKMMKPYLVSGIQSNGLLVQEFQPTVVEEQIANESIIKAAQQCMLAVTKEGTAQKVFKEAAYNVAGKTGTAHVAGKDINYNDGVYQASFAGYFPYERPAYTCVVVIKTKKHPAKHFGGHVAAPVFKEVADKLMAIQKERSQPAVAAAIRKDSSHFFYAGETGELKRILNRLEMAYTDSNKNQSWSTVYSNNYRPVVLAKQVAKNNMPDVKGMGLKDALYLLESMHVKVVVKGKGKVVNQSVSAGALINKNMVVVLELS